MNAARVFRIAVLPGDGIGQEVIAEGVKALRAAASGLRGVTFTLDEFSVGARECRSPSSSASGNTMPSCWAPWACRMCAAPAASR